MRTTLRQRLLEKINKNGPRHPELATRCWLWTASTDGSGYGKINIGNGMNERAHRVAYALFVQPIPPGALILHACDVPRCCNPRHLRVGTIQDNMADMVRRGRQAKGERKHTAKLIASQVLEIRKLWDGGIQQKEIAKRFGVSPENISAIVNNRSWKHLQ
jgi:hypothetical protein